ncbi:hypothetical protein TWF281_009905 [Arthrobotrys megalospora]
MASARTTRVNIPAFPLPAGTGLLPTFEEGSRIEIVREPITNPSNRWMYQFFVSMGETAVTTQLRQIARQTGTSNVSSNPSWKTIRNTILSEEQLVILSEHFRLREYFLPETKRCKRYMGTNTYTSKLFLVYVAGYLQSLDPGTPMIWLQDIMIVIINGMIDQCLSRRIQIGIPKLVQELPYNLVDERAIRGQEIIEEELSAIPMAPTQQEGFRLDTAKRLGEAAVCPTIDQLIKSGWKYSESKVEIAGQTFWLVVLFVGEMDPISMMRDTLDQARSAATETAADYLKSYA